MKRVLNHVATLHAVILLLVLSLSSLQSQTYEWAKGMGGTDLDLGYSLALDADGNVYTIGYFRETVDFDPGPGTALLTSAGSSDIFVQKLDSLGNFCWVQQMGGDSWDVGYSLALDGSGNIYTTGFFQGTADFDPGPGGALLTSAGQLDIFIQKMDSAGNFLWAKRMGGTDRDEGRSLALDAAGNVYTTGYFRETVDFDPGPGVINLIPEGYWDIFVQKLDSSGNFRWAKAMGGPNSELATSLALDADANVYTTGRFQGVADFDPGLGTALLTGAGSLDVFIQKMDSSGSFLWAKGMGGTGLDLGSSLAVDTAGNAYITGWFEGTADFDPGPGTALLTSAGFMDIFVQKLDNAGNLSWAKRMGGVSLDQGYGITLDGSGNLYTIGKFYGTVDFDPGPGTVSLTSVGSEDIFIQKLNSAGNFLWAKGMGGTSSDEGYGLVLDATGNIHTTGWFSAMADFDPGVDTATLISAGGRDIFVCKISPCELITTSIVADTACNSYSLNNQTYTASGTYTQTVVNTVGCDSIITLHLTLLKTDSTLADTADCNGYTLNGQTYTTSGMYTQVLTNAAGCDSVITLDLSIGTPMTTFADTACHSYTLNQETYASSGVYTQTLTTPAGCDSVITLYLLIQPIDTSVVQTDTSLTANESGFYLAYQWIDCENGRVAIPEETNQTFTPAVSGSYAVVLSYRWCTDTSACHLVSVVGIDPEQVLGMKAYPNPATDFLTIETEEVLPEATVTLFHLTGQKLLQFSVSQLQTLNLDMSQFKTGLYFLKVTSRGRIAVMKVMKV